jgi:RNA polymerase sigma-70 factor, ECF subfamily
VPEPTHEVVEAARRGDPLALERLILEQQSYIYSVALAVARNADDAGDVMQEACIKLARTMPTYRGESSFTTWLYRLVVNVGIDLLRRRGRTLSLDDGGEVALPSRDRLGDPQIALERSDLAKRVRAALDRLPDGQRLALTLQYFEDVPYEQIAEIMGLPLNTVKSHIRRGKERLAAELADLAPSAV